MLALTYRMSKDSEWELCFPLAVSVSYQNGDRGKHSEVVRGMWRAISEILRPRKLNVGRVNTRQ
jgi:hypothetical protein